MESGTWGFDFDLTSLYTTPQISQPLVGLPTSTNLGSSHAFLNRGTRLPPPSGPR